VTDSKNDPEPAAPDRAAWVLNLRRLNEREEDALAPVFDERWGESEDTHRAFLERFLSKVPSDGSVLDAACGTGKYFGMVLASGRSVLGVDHAAAYLALAGAKFPQVSTEKRDLQELLYREEFDGVMCIDAMEMIPPEDWPIVLGCFRRALRPKGWRSPSSASRRNSVNSFQEQHPVVRQGSRMLLDVLWLVHRPDP